MRRDALVDPVSSYCLWREEWGRGKLCREKEGTERKKIRQEGVKIK